MNQSTPEGLDSLYNEFAVTATKNGSQVARFSDLHGALSYLLSYAAEMGIKEIISTQQHLLTPDQTRAYGLTLLNPTRASITTFTQADAGLFLAQLAIAETGSLLYLGDSIRERLITTLPPYLFALVPVHKLVRGLSNALEYLTGLPEFPGYTGFISGPSLTGDIEGILTFGVHGPKKLLIAFVDQPLTPAGS